MQKIVLASGNPGKLFELQALLAPLQMTLLPLSELGIGQAPEPHRTFVENALAKARHAAAASGLPALADDAGLCVHAFGGQPGVDTAYYATRFGYEKSDANNVRALLEQMQGAAPRGSAPSSPCARQTTRSRSSPRAAWRAKSRASQWAMAALASTPSCSCPNSAKPSPSCPPK